MSDEKKYMERDRVMFQREGFRCGYGYSWRSPDDAGLMAVRNFPLPKRVVPRVVTREDGYRLRIVDEQLQYSFRGECWRDYDRVSWTDEMRAAMLDLLANPTEEVEDA